MSRLHVIYVPGLGDNKPYGQNIAIKLWRLFGVHGHYHAVNWATGDFRPKLDELLAEIDSYLANGDRVALLGFSAGASAVLNAFAARRTEISAVICVSGFIEQNYSGPAHNYHQNPAFGQSLDVLSVNLQTFTAADKQRLLTVYPGQDRRVAQADAIISGVTEKRIPAKGHAQSIAYALTIGAFSLTRHIKKLTELS